MAVIESKGKGYSLFNGVKLPHLPEWDKQAYPYAVICRNSSGVYTFFAYSAPCVYGTYTALDGSYTTTALIPADGSTYKNGALRNNEWRIASSDSNARPIDLEYAGTVVIWSNFEIADTITDNSVYLAASEPITLDGMNVIEWDGDTTGLEKLPGTTAYLVSNATDVDVTKKCISVRRNSLDKLITINAAFTYKEEGYYTGPMSYVKDASEAYPTKGIYAAYNASSKTVLVAYYPIPHVVESKGDGYSLFNGFKFPHLPEWDKETYPYAHLYRSETGSYAIYLSTVPYVFASNDNGDSFVLIADGGERKPIQLKDDGWFVTPESDPSFSEMIVNSGPDDPAALWSNYEIRDTRVDNNVYLTASEPISLDGMNVIEWDGDTEGLELFAGTTNFWRVSNAVDVNTEKGFVEAHINEMHGTISGNVKAPLTEKEGYWELLPIRYVPAASEAYPTTGVYFIETKLMQPRLFAYYPIEPAEPEQPEIDRGKLFLLYRIFSPDVFYAMTGKKHWSE